MDVFAKSGWYDETRVRTHQMHHPTMSTMAWDKQGKNRRVAA